ncbi:MAG: cyclic-di-AMP receptor [Anaerolineales bacterium]|jgi:uncharacterized protein YaaQ|nr:cyclic-di-AMP receptor [Anaerolineales bacterium]
MKLIIAILRDSDSDPVSQALVQESYRVTRIASTGGFLRRGSSTLMIGTEADRVDRAIDLIKENLGPATEPGVNRANLFVIKVDHFHQV